MNCFYLMILIVFMNNFEDCEEVNLNITQLMNDIKMKGKRRINEQLVKGETMVEGSPFFHPMVCQKTI